MHREEGGALLTLDLAQVVGHLATLRRFPVEPLAGESPSTVLLRSGGLVGDRVYDLRDAKTGEPLTAWGTPSLLRYTARYAEDLVAENLERWARVRTPAGREYTMADPDWLTEIGQAIGRPVRLTPHVADDASKLHLVSRQTLRLAERTYGAPLEQQRLRANFIVEITDGKAFDEHQWIGRRLYIGEGLLEISDVSTGCLVTTFRPQTAIGDHDLLEGFVKIHGGNLGVMVHVVAGSRLRTGDPVVLLD